MTVSPTFRWSDAWLFLAIGYAAEHGDATLASVIAMADGIQHAIPTLDELNGAMGRLARAGLLVPDRERFVPTVDGWALLRQADAVRGTVFDAERTVEQLLGAAAWSPGYDPADARGDEPALISPEDLEKSLAGYRQQISG